MSDSDVFLKELEGLPTVDDAMSESWEAALPVPVIYLWVHNGSPQNQQGVEHFGGFAASEDKVDELITDKSLEIPGTWVKEELHGRDGSYNAYMTRSVIVAPVGYRVRWVDGQGGFSSGFNREEGFTRRHIQVLCGLGRMTKSGTAFAGHAVLTAKGYQAGYLMNSLRDFYNALASTRKEAGVNGVAQFAFWHSVGTFGEEPEFERVGTSAQSTITPIRPHPKFTSEAITTQKLKGIFVGRPNYESLVELRQGAEQWLGAWQNGGVEEETNNNLPSPIEAIESLF